MNQAKQAVVIIHGMGEARPMDTVRKFVRAIFSDPGQTVYSKPDAGAELLDQRRLQVGNTHFFELYWAYHAESPKVTTVLLWIFTLMFRPVGAVPPGLRTLWWVLWLAVGLFGWLLLPDFLAAFSRGQISWAALSKWLFAEDNWWIAVAGLIWLGVSYFLTNYLGDAFRYFVSSPGNVRMRQNIRSSGLALLRGLQSQGYGRIVVVGHSLGSVVGYDLLKILWDEQNDKSKYPPTDPLRLPRAITALESQLPDELALFQQLQGQLHLEGRNLDSPWSISDFISVGSPLTHAALFISNTSKDLRQRIGDRELPTCPPQIDHDSQTFAYLKRAENGAENWVLHHAAVFGPTRWHNLYIRAYGGLWGDFIGGPVAHIFGRGVADRAVEPSPNPWRYLVFAHNQYWSGADSSSLQYLRSVIRDWKPPLEPML